MSLTEAQRSSGAVGSRHSAMDPFLATILESRKHLRALGPYKPLSLDEVTESCRAILPHIGAGLTFSGVTRLGGGGSKEQFVLSAETGGRTLKYVVRTDPLEAIAVSGRMREAEVMKLAATEMPVPEVAFVDEDARYFRQPTMIMEFVQGVTKPRTSAAAITGLNVMLGEQLRSKLSPQYLDYFTRLHRLPASSETLPSHAIPRPGGTDAALWQIGFWGEVWEQDALEPVPLMTFVLQWLKANAPVCANPCVLHGDYRLGNFLFDEETAQITAILDWELAHIGDHHEDVALVLSPATMVFDGVWRASDLFEPDQWVDIYQAAGGLAVDPKVLHYYEVLTAFKSYVVVVATATSVAKAGHSHQNVLLARLAALGPDLLRQLCDLLERA